MSRTSSLLGGIAFLTLAGVSAGNDPKPFADPEDQPLVTRYYEAGEQLISQLCNTLFDRWCERRHLDKTQRPRCVLPSELISDEGGKNTDGNLISGPQYWIMTGTAEEHAKFQSLCVKFTGKPAHELSLAEVRKIDDDFKAAQIAQENDPNNPFRKK